MLKKSVIWILVLVFCAVAFAACSPAASTESSAPATSAAAESSAAASVSESAAQSAAQSAVESAVESATESGAALDGSGVTIGVSVGDLRLERWQRDMKYMEEAAKAAGATVFSQSADGDEQKQLQQVDAMLSKGCNVLIIIPVSSKTLSTAVEAAHQDNVKVIAYDRLIENCDLDYYITFDMVGVGKLQATYLLGKVPKGKYFLMEGPKEDSNAQLFYQGQMEVLQPEIDNGNIKVVGEQWADGWLEENAMKIMENALTANNNAIDAICDANDSTASGAIQALEAQGLAGKIPITGQDCDLAACKRIVAGTQTMSVYKPLNNLASAAVELAIKVANGETIDTNGTYNNGKIDVPSINLPITACDQTNIMDTVIKDGFQSYDEVYADIPESERPQQ